MRQAPAVSLEPTAADAALAGSVSEEHDVERPGDSVARLFQRDDGAPKFPRGNARDGLGPHDMRNAIDVEHGIEVAKRRRDGGGG